MEEHTQKPLNLIKFNFGKNLNHLSKDRDENLTDPTCFDYYLAHDFHKLNIKIKETDTIASQSFIHIFLLSKANP